MSKETEGQSDVTCESLDQSELVAMIELQLSEMDMLQSMFPDPRELEVDDPSVLCDLRDFAEGRTLLLPPRLDLVINLDGRLSMSVNLPHHYPAVQPSVFVRSQTLNRDAQHRLNQELLGYLKTLQQGDLCVGPAVTWLQEKGETFFDDCPEEVSKSDDNLVEIKDTKFARLWIYSHHIYSKVKRKDILDLSKEFDLTGFCLPGKPGIICVEGLSRNTEDWWHKVRSWNWQKILCKKHEDMEITAEQDLSKLRRFSTFEELGSENNIRVKSSGFHVDMGDVFRYLENHESGYVFKEYFGINGRPT
ncbi:RWD domain-containing protein 2A-like [Homarus americanus]|uniref:RWD domain-containing protein 2A-like n=1 Tax=Homarus americanus TaxID=6706 RepID=A0A8J5JYX7_HOMAM|nr:RWD domain-containing protein 2A-like [Homarus americanus]